MIMNSKRAYLVASCADGKAKYPEILTQLEREDGGIVSICLYCASISVHLFSFNVHRKDSVFISNRPLSE